MKVTKDAARKVVGSDRTRGKPLASIGEIPSALD
jgi:hypothetical protein